MATNYTGNATPTLNNAPANSWATDAEKRSHVGNTYLVTGSGGTSGNVYAFENYPSAVVKEVPASGLPAEIVTITDGGENLPMTSAEVSLSPIQDLNGYDSPWPAGGGKNKADPSGATKGSCTVSGDLAELTVTQTSNYGTLTFNLKGEANTAYTCSAKVKSTSTGGNALYSVGSGNYVQVAVGGTITAQLTTDANGESYFRLRPPSGQGQSNSAVFTEVQIEKGTQKTDFAPYSNICPISGHAGAELYRTGKNLWEKESSYSLARSGTIISNATLDIPLKAGSYTLSMGGNISSAASFSFRRSDSTIIGAIQIASAQYDSGKGKYIRSFQLADDAYKINLYVSGAVDINEIQLELGSSATAYEPYQGNTYSVTFTDQGTVYGGTLDFVSGKLKVDRAMVDLGTLNWTYDRFVPRFYTTELNNSVKFPANNDVQANCLSSMYESTTFNKLYTREKKNGTFAFGLTGTLSVINTAYTDAADFKSAMSGAQAVYELATPLEYTLSPQQIETLQGENNVLSDAGEISKLVYRSNQYVMAYDWFETWTMPKITRNNGNVIVLPYPKKYTPDIYDVDASTTGRNAAGTMIRDRVAVKHKFNYTFPPLSQADATELLNAVRDPSFTLTTASPETGAKTNYRVYVGDRSLPVYWMPNHNQNSWLYESLTMNLIEM